MLSSREDSGTEGPEEVVAPAAAAEDRSSPPPHPPPAASPAEAGRAFGGDGGCGGAGAGAGLGKNDAPTPPSLNCFTASIQTFFVARILASFWAWSLPTLFCRVAFDDNVL